MNGTGVKETRQEMNGKRKSGEENIINDTNKEKHCSSILKDTYGWESD